MRRFIAWLYLGLGAACASPDAESTTEAEVVVDGTADLMQRLARVRVSVHALDTLATWKPLETRDFFLAKGASPASDEVRAPISFGIARSSADRFELVVEGFESRQATAQPVIEHKSLVTFQPGRRTRVVVSLVEACAALSRPCMDLSETCHASARACGPVPEADDGGARDAGTTTVPMDVAAASTCPADNPCSADYPCVPTGPSGYTCLGRHAEWPMPMADSKTPFAYDALTDSRVVTDQVTGLVWQREMPGAYDGCSGSRRGRADTCTWDEAKLYCDHLELAGRTWRLPSKIELESLIDTSSGAATIHEPDFTPLRYGTFWTSSPNPFVETATGRVTHMWTVSFFDGMSGFAKSTEPFAVRCVSGIPQGNTTPFDRYQLDAATDTVTDLRTHLTWQRSTSSPMKTLDDARKYCEARGPGFRVPMIKEVMTLVDPTRSSPATDPVFEKTPLSFGWATALRADGGLDVWRFELAYGASYSPGGFDFGASQIDISSLPAAYVRCVR